MRLLEALSTATIPRLAGRLVEVVCTEVQLTQNALPRQPANAIIRISLVIMFTAAKGEPGEFSIFRQFGQQKKQKSLIFVKNQQGKTISQPSDCHGGPASTPRGQGGLVLLMRRQLRKWAARWLDLPLAQASVDPGKKVPKLVVLPAHLTDQAPVEGRRRPRRNDFLPA